MGQVIGWEQGIEEGYRKAIKESLEERDLMTTDYSKSAHWFALPLSQDKEVGVFFVLPTTWSKVDKHEPNICAIDNPALLNGSKLAYDMDATVFETVGNIYAPYYRQADGVYCLALPLEGQDKLVGDIPASDVSAAFDYYIKNYNHDRPFILAGHSQGWRRIPRAGATSSVPWTKGNTDRSSSI